MPMYGESLFKNLLARVIQLAHINHSLEWVDVYDIIITIPLYVYLVFEGHIN